ncbi:serine/threonine-protein kinase/endoribonuclease IRE1a isoform X1 [Senna tora]|uniref:non-specific serine/threonine protein kinase n=1 Tax=Senna tora TaxID=362788 RepID=A0A834TVP3_9FABA|nr:serine/threonine-protein kinase/endoribonuclease IRE1a isoform X1 [Senna tora]
MKYRFLCISSLLIILSIVVFSSLTGDVSESKSESSQVSLVGHYEEGFDGLALPAARSLLSHPSKPSTALIAAPDQNGTIHLVESGSMRIIWSFPTGSPIYGSYQASLNKDNENISGLSSEFIEVGDDWGLYQRKSFGKMRLLTSIEDVVRATPKISNDGVVTLGSKRITVFEVDAKTGRIFRSYTASDFDNSYALSSGNRQSVQNVMTNRNQELVKTDPLKLNMPEPLLMLFRTDYSLQAVGPGSEKVVWSMTVAEFEAVFYCQHENPSGAASFDSEGKHASDIGLDFALPYPCQEKKKVYRLPKNFLLQPSIIETLPEADHENKMLPMPSSNLMLPSQPNNDRFLIGPDEVKMLPMPVPNSLPSLQPETGFYVNNDNAVDLPQPPREITVPGEVDLNRVKAWSTILPLMLFIVILLVFSIYYYFLLFKKQINLKDQNNEFDSKSTPKKKKMRKSGKNNGTVDRKDKHLSSEDEDVMARSRADKESWQHFSKVDECADGRRIGKLFVSNKEIAKGSNGTIVLEGIYECRAVAVKRLVQAHHDEAFKEIQNLIASDRHSNIVRWYGVEYDQDFVYLALERCTCNLDDLIQIHSDLSENPVFNKNQALIKAQLETGKHNMQNLWKANGFPSPLLLKLMRDVVSGLCHLHELGIVHRDLKPQNILIIKERSLCAKLSDMGISKRLLEDMSSFGYNNTGCGSSGWQAPEQLVKGRQTRSVDLFSLGCVLFFCITGGRHPFGERIERDVNIVKNQKDLFLVDFIPEAEDLISCLLNPDPDLRPKAVEVLHHPFFWDSEMRLSFLRDASDRVELEDRETGSDLLKALESSAPVALGAKWDEKMEPAFINNIGRYRRYKYDSVRDLLRVMRNKLNHFRELPQEIQDLVGPVPEGFNDYFANRFPRLLIEVYKVICKYCKAEECFQRYFKHVE